MTTTTAVRTGDDLPDVGPRIDVSGTPRVPFLRLVRVELRKMTDTRAGRWLMGVTIGVLVLAAGIVVTISVFDDGFSMELSDWQGMLTFLTTLLLPTIAIMSVTQEWSQRTGLVTFALEPHRLRVVLAKLVAVVLFGVATLAIAAVVGAVGHALLEITDDVSWSLSGTDLAWTLYLQLVYFLMAFGLAMVFLSTPGSIVVYYIVALVLPQIVYGMLYFLLSWGPDVVPWLDLGYAVAAFREQLPEPPNGDVPDLGVGPIVATFALWVVLPFAVGLRRIQRVELK